MTDYTAQPYQPPADRQPRVKNPTITIPKTIVRDGAEVDMTQTFKLSPNVPPMMLLRMSAAGNKNARHPISYAVALWDLLCEAMPEDEHPGEVARFEAWLDECGVTDVLELAQYIREMGEAIAERPTPGQSSSPDGPPATLNGSAVAGVTDTEPTAPREDPGSSPL